MSLTKKYFYGWTVVSVCTFSMMLGYGMRHSFSVFFPPVLEEFHWDRGSTAMMLSLHLLIYGGVSPFIGMLSYRWHAKWIIIVGIVVMTASIMACGLSSELWHFYVLFGVCTPVGLALIGSPIVNPTITNWFERYKGLAFSIAQLGSGISFLYAIYAELLISSLGWRIAYFLLGITLLVILTPIILVYYAYHPQEKGLTSLGSMEKSDASTGIPKERSTDICWTLRRAIGTHQLWLLILSQTLFWGVGCYLLLAHQVKYSQDIGFSASFSASTFGLFGVAMIIGQVCSSISDKVGREAIFVAGCALAAGSTLLLVITTDTTSSWVLIAYAVGFGFGAGLQSPTVFVGASDLFSGRSFASINGLILAGMGVGGAFGPWIGGYLHDLFGDYRYAFGLSMSCFVLSAIMFVIAAPRNPIRQHGV